MKIRPLFFGKIVKGALRFDNPMELTRYLSRLENQEVQVSIQKKKKNRSTAENNYYHGVVVKMVAEHFGYTHDEAHEALKVEFLKVHTEGKLDTVKSTSKLSTVEMEDFLSRVRVSMSLDWELDIPAPNEVDFRI